MNHHARWGCNPGDVISFIIFILRETWNGSILIVNTIIMLIIHANSLNIYVDVAISEYVSSTISCTGKQYSISTTTISFVHPVVLPVVHYRGTLHSLGCGCTATTFTRAHIVPSTFVKRLYLRFAITLHDHSFASSQSLKHLGQYRYVDQPVANGLWPLNCR